MPAPVISLLAMGAPGDQHRLVSCTSSMNHNENPMDIDRHAKSDSEGHELLPSTPNLVPDGHFKRPLSATAADDAAPLRRRGMGWIYDDSDPTVELLSSFAKHDNRPSLLSDVSMGDVLGDLEIGDAKSLMEEGSPKSMFDSAGKAPSTHSSTSEFRGDMD